MRATSFRLRILCAAVLCAVSCVGFDARAAQQAPPSDALKQKQEEVDRLQRDLDKARTDLKQLEQENKRLREEQSPKKGVDVTPSAPVTARPIATLPPLAADETVDAVELAAHFLSDPAAAAQRYAGRLLRVKGEVERFDVKFVVRRYDLLLDTGHRDVAVSCGFNYVDKYRAVYTTRKGQTLTARFANSSEVDLLKIGESVVVQGRCKGFKNGEVILAGCTLVR